MYGYGTHKRCQFRGCQVDAGGPKLEVELMITPTTMVMMTTPTTTTTLHFPDLNNNHHTQEPKTLSPKESLEPNITFLPRQATSDGTRQAPPNLPKKTSHLQKLVAKPRTNPSPPLIFASFFFLSLYYNQRGPRPCFLSLNLPTNALFL